MRYYLKTIKVINGNYLHLDLNRITCTKFYHTAPFFEFYKNTTGTTIPEEQFKVLKKKHPHIDEINHDRLQCTLQILQKYGITAQEACQHLHLFSMNPITMDNYGEILRECGFIKILPPYIIKYHTLVKSRTISQLKKQGLMPQDMILEQQILDKLVDWPHRTLREFPDSRTSILTVRVNILERYLSWKLSVTTEEFQKYIRNYLPLKHKPMSDIQESINIAQNDLEFDNAMIRRNGFIMAMDPLHTKLIIENVKTLAGMDIREAIKLEPAILKNNYNSVLQIRNIMKENRITNIAQRRCLKIYCMCPETVRQRLDELKSTREYQILASNPRVLFMIVHKKKMIKRLETIETSNKRCYSLNSLVGSTKVFNTYLSSFGEKVCSKDLAALIISSLNLSDDEELDVRRLLLNQLKRQKYWLHAAIGVVYENIQFLKQEFNDRTIYNNCQILLYPVSEVKQHINMLLNIRESNIMFETFSNDLNYNTLKSSLLTDDQILSLVLYKMEKKYHFSGDGIWAKQDAAKLEIQSLK